MDFVFIVVGFALILGGANYLTDGSAALAKRFNISEFIIGLTIIALGTSAPELVVSVMSALKGSTQMAIGNVVGSNTFNTLVVLGICSLFNPVTFTEGNIKRDIPYGVLASAILLLVTFSGKIETVYGIMMLLIYLAIIFSTLKLGLKDRNSVEMDDDIEIKHMPLWMTIAMIVGGLSALIFGGNILLEGAINIAHKMHIPESIISITLLAGGTSLPELAASLVALLKGKKGMALGNVIGSNIANILLVLGVSSIIKPLEMGGITIFDISVVVTSSLLVYLAAFTPKRNQIGKVEGVIFLILYVGYIWWLI